MGPIGVIMIAVLIVMSTLQSLLTRYFSATYPGREDLASPVFTIFSGFVTAIISVALAGFSFTPAPLTVVFAIFNALALVLFNHSIIRASVLGPYSITMVFMIAGGIILPAIVTLFFGDAFNPIKFICIAVIVFSVYLVARKPGETYQNKLGFFVACFCLGLSNGIYGSLLDSQQRLTGVGDKEEMIAVTYFFAATISLIMLLAKEKRHTLSAFKQTKKSLVFFIAASLVVAFAVQLVVYTLSLIDTTILYTFDNSSVFLLSVLFSCIFLKEKLSKYNIIGCVTLCLALVCMALSDQLIALF